MFLICKKNIFFAPPPKKIIFLEVSASRGPPVPLKRHLFWPSAKKDDLFGRFGEGVGARPLIRTTRHQGPKMVLRWSFLHLFGPAGHLGGVLFWLPKDGTDEGRSSLRWPKFACRFSTAWVEMAQSVPVGWGSLELVRDCPGSKILIPGG